MSPQSPGRDRGREGGDGAQDLKETHWKPQMEMVGMPKGHGVRGPPSPETPRGSLPAVCFLRPPCCNYSPLSLSCNTSWLLSLLN